MVTRARVRVHGRVAKDRAPSFALDRMEKPRRGIFDTGTKKPRPVRRTIPGGWNPIEED
jgi:hypothetical protein